MARRGGSRAFLISMTLDSDDFELFGLPRRFQLDRGVLDTRWRALQAEVHPDRFAAQGQAAQRVAMQWAVRVNEAYQRLRDPLKRAAYLCELAGMPVDPHDNTSMSPAFLMQQMEWREALEEARSIDEVEALAEEVSGRKQVAFAELGRALDERNDVAFATEQVRALMFVERFAEDVDHRLEALGQ
jgi:molecular chaperone HscB